MSIKFPKLIKEILKPLPKNDYPVLNTLGASHIGMSINTYEAFWSEKGKDR